MGLEPTTQKTHGLSTTPFVKVLVRVVVRLTTCKSLTNSLPELSLITSVSIHPKPSLLSCLLELLILHSSTPVIINLQEEEVGVVSKRS